MRSIHEQAQHGSGADHVASLTGSEYVDFVKALTARAAADAVVPTQASLNTIATIWERRLEAADTTCRLLSVLCNQSEPARWFEGVAPADLINLPQSAEQLKLLALFISRVQPSSVMLGLEHVHGAVSDTTATADGVLKVLVILAQAVAALWTVPIEHFQDDRISDLWVQSLHDVATITFKATQVFQHPGAASPVAVDELLAAADTVMTALAVAAGKAGSRRDRPAVYSTLDNFFKEVVSPNVQRARDGWEVGGASALLGLLGAYVAAIIDVEAVTKLLDQESA